MARNSMFLEGLPLSWEYPDTLFSSSLWKVIPNGNFILLFSQVNHTIDNIGISTREQSEPADWGSTPTTPTRAH